MTTYESCDKLAKIVKGVAMARWLVVAVALMLSACADRYIPVAATAPDKSPDYEAARATCHEQAAAASGNASLLGPVAGVVWGAAQGAATGALSGGSAEGAVIGAAAG